MKQRSGEDSGAEPPWEQLGAFLAVLREGSLSAAARSLGSTQPTVRRQLGELESSLGVALFTRSKKGLFPTEAAHSVRAQAQALGSAARALLRGLSASEAEARGVVRVACSQVLGAEVLPGMLAALQREHPGLRFELAPSNRNEDLLRREADVAVRMVRPTQTGLVAKRAAVLEVGLYATRGYLEERGIPKSLAALREGHALLGRDRDSAQLERFLGPGVTLRKQDFALRTDDDVALLAALRAGMGIGPCQAGLSAGLERVLPSVRFEMEAWVLTHEDLRKTRRVSLVFEHLVRSLAEFAAGRLSGGRAAAGGRGRRP